MGNVDYEREKEIYAIAKEIITISRNSILLNLRYLDLAIANLKLIPVDIESFTVDGEKICFNPDHILNLFKTNRNLLDKALLHMILHCIFRHMFVIRNVDHDTWNLACDIAVENIISELNIPNLGGTIKSEQRKVFKELNEKVDVITAEKVYKLITDKLISKAEIENMKKLFYVDDHNLWYEFESVSSQDDNSDDTNDKVEKDNESTKDNSSSSNNLNYHKELSEYWEEISQQMQMEIEYFQKQRGDLTYSMTQNIKEIKREKYDYSEFLKKFAVMTEAMQINHDEFDYVFYTYGLKIYKKMPLIEPLEYRETKLIKDFVIVIDTSGSVSGSLVETFLRKTFNILKSTESFCKKINIYIIQCDCEIQEVLKINSQEKIDEYIENMTIKGLGGTDFRPAFQYIDNLVEGKELTKLKGIICFTDGHGIFPQQKPHYQCAFVFADGNKYTTPPVPPWAIKMIFDKDETLS